MNILQFAQTYCQDVIEAARRASELLELEGFSYDEIIEDQDGVRIKVINTANFQIPLMDILGMDRADFARVWGHVECLEAYDRYVENLIILEGADVLNQVRDDIARAQASLQLPRQLPTDF